MRKVKWKNIAFRTIVLIMAVMLVFVTTKANIEYGDDFKYIYSTFIGNKSAYNGMIEVWNIDSYESGLKSKSSYLEQMGKKFQKTNKGVYVLVRNLTIGECENLLNNGVVPDLISCSYGVSEKIKDFIRPFESDDVQVFDNFLNAGRTDDGNLYALPWCFGIYALISTKTKLEKAGYEFEGVKLNEIVYESSYEYKIGKKIKTSKSLIFGSGMYLLPKKSLTAYNKSRSIQIEERINEELNLKSQYSAYTSFLSDNATILLGTHRDVFRMMNREEKGKVSDVVYLPLLNWSDLVQFSFLCKNDDNQRKLIAEKFAKFLVDLSNQKMLEEIGMFPVVTVENLKLKGVMCDIICENFSNIEVDRVINKV